tara:strand:- start:240 stop:1223 length:984 start_codon:yes stop_codon:yes gene_type:complete
MTDSADGLGGLSPNWVMAHEAQSENIKKYSKGISCGSINEPMPIYIQAPCEKVIKGQNNSYIVLGRDRVTSMETGYGSLPPPLGKQASMIDLVVGRHGANPFQVDEQGMSMFCHSDPVLDAARIYISQKTDVDKNFNLARGSIGYSKSRSAIALKADGIRIIGREGIKLITRSDPKNSQGGEIGKVFGIDLIAGNDDQGKHKLQPIPKGENLSKALGAMYDEINILNGIVVSLVTIIIKFYKDLGTHTHIVPPSVVAPTPAGVYTAPATTFPSVGLTFGIATAAKDLSQKCFMGCSDQKQNIVNKRLQYLDPKGGPKYINSRFNKVN